MPKKSLASAALLACWGGLASAQAPDPQSPPPVLSIFREEIKPGRMGPHDKLNASYVAAVSKTGSQAHWIGLVPISGDDNVTVFLQALGSFAAVEALRTEQDDLTAKATAAAKAEFDQLDKQGADLHNTQRTMLARYRPDLSFRPPKMDDVARARFIGIMTVRVKPGRGPEYTEYMKATNEARAKANNPIQTAVYQVMTGGPSGQFLTFRAYRSLKEWDDEFAAAEAMQKAMTEAMGGAEAAKKVRMTLADAAMVVDHALYAMHPKISRPAPEFAKADVAFWSPPAPAATSKALATKKETAPKPAEKQ